MCLKSESMPDIEKMCWLLSVSKGSLAAGRGVYICQMITCQRSPILSNAKHVNRLCRVRLRTRLRPTECFLGRFAIARSCPFHQEVVTCLIGIVYTRLWPNRVIAQRNLTSTYPIGLSIGRSFSALNSAINPPTSLARSSSASLSLTN